jgi:serine/threonine protein kinase
MTVAQQQEIFDAALEITDAAERGPLLDRACAGNPQIRKQIEELLAAQAGAEKFFSDSITSIALTTEELKAADQFEEASAAKLDEAIGSQIGPYRLLRRLGEGGCGVVYLAEQEKPVRRRVALKIIKLGMDTKSVIARFEAEQLALALMDHPNIARVIDAGATDAGRPFFVMELVQGVKFTTYCDEKNLPLRERLHLFIQVCHAIQHAHQKGIIHRDIKPSNILVAMHDGVAVPKVIDFGIAKAIEGRLTDQTVFTPHEHFIGTPAYMSPEQAELGGLDVDTRSDIYSLGVLLYELLTGKTPFDQKELIAAGLDAMRRTLRERDPLPPSGRIKLLALAELAASARQRGVEATRLRSVLTGDLDWIVMKALEKDRRRRYETANGLAADVKRYLDNEPVVASPPSRFYRLQKLMRRNRVTFAAGTVVVLTLIASSTVSTWLYLREREARRQAERAEQQKLNLQREAEHLDELRQTAEDRQKLLEAIPLFGAGQNELADALLEKIVVGKPASEHAVMYRTLGDWNAAQSRWPQAAHRFATLVQINQSAGQDTTLDDLRYAVVLTELGTAAEYDRFRESLVARYAGTDNPIIAERVIKACLLQPAGPELMRALGRFSEVAEQSLAISSSNLDPMAAWRAYSLALLAYRQGNYSLAIDRCERSRNYNQEMQSRIASVCLLLAMSHSQLEQQAQAHTELAKGREILKRHFPAGTVVSQRWEGFWFDWLIAQIHQREMEKLVK